MRPIAAALMLAAAAPAPTPAVAGRWLTADGSALVEIGACGSALCGRVVRVLGAAGSAALDSHNPDPARRGRRIEGLTILSALVPAGDAWTGNIYDPKSGRTYSARVWPEAGALEVQGCWGVFCRTQVWTRPK